MSKQQKLPETFRTSLTAALVYLAISVVYIFFSDQIVESITDNKDTLSRIQTFKGIAFVLITSVVIFIIFYINLKKNEYTSSELAESERRFRNVFSQSPFPIIIHADDGAVLEINSAWQSITGYKHEEIPTIDEWIKRAYSENHEQIKSHIQNLYKINEEVAEGEFRILTKSGSSRVWEFKSAPLGYSADGRKIIISMASDITLRKKHQMDALNSHNQIRALLTQLDTAIETEKINLSREIHDVLGQALTGIKMDLVWLKSKEPASFESAKARIDYSIQLINEAIGNVRNISRQLRPSELDDLGIVAAVESELDKFSERAGIPCNLSCDFEEIKLEKFRAIVVFRILQESLTNIARHSKATQVDVNLSLIDGFVHLTVNDNGVGIQKHQIENFRSLGILGMKERALSVGGSIMLTSEGKSRGTTLRAKIPLT